MDPWQLDLCKRLEEAARNPGTRLIIHGPPQFGKTVITGQRYPAYYLGTNPSSRVRIATYSEDRAIASARAIKSLVLAPEFKDAFGDLTDGIPSVSQWSSKERIAINDGQPSFQALGLGTGFVGTGADLLIVDDPYASDRDAFSSAIRNQVWSWWLNTVEARIGREVSIVIMYHRWHDDDLAGRLLKEQPGQWEYIRYSAEYDGEGDDPLGREEGELLSPRFTKEDLSRKRENMGSAAYRALFQGLPLPLGGGLFQREWFKVISREELERRITTSVVADRESIITSAMGVDLAVTAKTSADWTVALPGILTDRNNIYLLPPYRAQAEWPDSRREIITRANKANIRVIGVDSTGPQKGLVQDLAQSDGLGARGVKGLQAVSDKEVRARGVAPIAEQGRIYLVDNGSDWITKFLDELSVFPQGRNDDQVDALSNLIEVLNLPPDPGPNEVKGYARAA